MKTRLACLAAAVLTALALSVSLAACGGGNDDLEPSAASSSPSASPVPTVSPTAWSSEAPTTEPT